MNGMTVQERLNDICRISGLSEDIVRRVLDAEKKSIVDSLKKGERANLIGRCVIRPEMRKKVSTGGFIESYIKVSSSIAPSLEASLREVDHFESPNDTKDEDKLPDGIMTTQISALI